MKKTITKKSQMTLINYKHAGRPAKNDAGIRHTKRPDLTRPSSLHLTVKIEKSKANLKNKNVLAILKKAIFNARRQGLKVIHYSLEYDHIHLIIEADNNRTLGKGMQAFGVTLAKAINRMRKVKGQVYKHRYHFRQITSSRQLKNVMTYIFNNGVKHKTSATALSPFNSIWAEKKYSLFIRGKLEIDFDLIRLLDPCRIFYSRIEFVRTTSSSV